MASITRGSNGRKTIQFVAFNGKRKSIRLGKATLKLAEEVKTRVENLNSAALAGMAVDRETADWVGKTGDALHDKLAAVGLVPARVEKSRRGLADFLDGYIISRVDVKPNTRRNLEACRTRLVEFFGPSHDISTITASDAENWLFQLRNKYAAGTVGRTVKRAKQFFQAGVRGKNLSENPFANLKAPGQSNPARQWFVDRDTIKKVIDACPDAEWRLLVVLSRFGGLRCPSEHLSLTWADVDWERGRLKVHSPKLEHTSGADRWIPIFPELRPYLEDCFDPGAVHVITRYRDKNSNLRTQLLRIIAKAGVKPWPKLFHNLRASRQTELSAEYPVHVVCAWMGNSALIAQKHYLQVRDEDFERGAKSGAVKPEMALQKEVQQPTAGNSTKPKNAKKPRKIRGSVQDDAACCCTVQEDRLPPVGLEPTTR